MALTQDDFEEMSITLTRSIRTADSETFLLISSNPEAGATFTQGRSRIGRVIIQYTEESLEKSFVNGTLLLEREWKQDAIQSIVTLIDRRVVDCIGAGSRHGRATFDVSVLEINHAASFTDRIEDDTDRGIYGIHKQIDQVQETVRSMPEEISDIAEEIADEQYEEIEGIINSDYSSEKKEEIVQENLKLGLERGLPTLLYEIGDDKDSGD